MKITLSYAEIQQILAEHVRSQGISVKHKDIRTRLLAENVRNQPTAFAAVIEITDKKVAPATETAIDEATAESVFGQ